MEGEETQSTDSSLSSPMQGTFPIIFGILFSILAPPLIFRSTCSRDNLMKYLIAKDSVNNSANWGRIV